MNEEIAAPMLGSSPIPEEQSRFCLLQSIRNRKFPQDNRWAERFKTFSDFKRMIYWADQPDGGIGVSFVDPVESCRYGSSLNNAGFLDKDLQKNTLDEIFSGATVINISSMPTSVLEQELFAKSRAVFQDYCWHWRSAYLRNGNRIDDVLIGWSLPELPPNIDWEGNPIYDDGDLSVYSTYPYDAFDSENEPCRGMIPNDFSNIPFNYRFLQSIVSDVLLLHKIEQYSFFSDGQLVDTKFGYYSPAYALALLQSFQKRNLLKVALRSFRNFVHYHPIDPITTLCDRITRQTYQGVTCGNSISKVRDMRHNYSMIDVYLEAEYDEIEARREACRFDNYKEDYVDDPDPYYQEMEYWNTH